MPSTFVTIPPCLRTQNPIRKRTGLGEQGSINLSIRPFSTLGDGYNFLSASSLLNRGASSLLSLITSCTLKAATDSCGQNMWSFKKIQLLQDGACARCVLKITHLLRALGMRNHLEKTMYSCAASKHVSIPWVKTAHRSWVSQLAINYTTYL